MERQSGRRKEPAVFGARLGGRLGIGVSDETERTPNKLNPRVHLPPPPPIRLSERPSI